MLQLLVCLFTPVSSMSVEALAKEHLLNVKETEIDNFNYISGTHNEDISIQNMGLREGVLVMRTGAEKNAMMRWESPNPTDNWSFTFAINEIHLDADEHAAIYLRYTKEKPLIGFYKGGEGVFEGMVIGAEFNGKTMDVVYAVNNGLDLSNNNSFETRRDKIDPARLRGVDELTFKIICTEKNLKVEIFDGSRLVYDRFKMYNVEKTKLNKSGMHFGLIADYPNASSRKAFVLKKAQLYSRTETKDYTATKTYVPNIETTVLPKEKIEHYDSDIRELIHRQGFMISLVKNALGELPDTRIAALQDDIINELKITTEKMSKLEAVRSDSSNKNVIGPRINDLDIRIKRVKGDLRDLEYVVENTRKIRQQYYHPADYVIFTIGCLMVVILGLREWSIYKARESRNK